MPSVNYISELLAERNVAAKRAERNEGFRKGQAKQQEKPMNAYLGKNELKI